MPSLHFIVNPAAGGNTCLHHFREVEETLRRQGADYSAVYSEYAGHASALARDALIAGRDCVVAVGGDGTAREVAQELVHTGVPMGILPFGTGNDLIRALGIPRETDEALALLLAGNVRTIDAAMVNDRLFLNVAGFGFDVDVLTKTKRYKRRFRGIFAYILGVLHALLDLRGHNVAITTGDSVSREDVLLVAVGNGTHIGGGMMVTPNADIADGLLDVCVVRRVGRLKVLRCLAAFIKGKHLKLDIVQYFKTDRIAISCADDTPVQLDGEIIDTTPAVFRVLPAALEMVSRA